MIDKKLLKIILDNVRPFRKGIGAAWGLLLLNILMQLPMPLLTMYLIDHVVASKDLNTLHLLSIGLLVFLLIQSFTTFLQKTIIIKIQSKIVTNIRSVLCRKLLRTKLEYFNKTKIGDVITRVTSDVGKLEGLLASTIVSFLTDSLTLIVGLVVLMFLHWKLALVSISIVPLFLLTIKYFSIRIKKASTTVQKELSNFTSALFEGFLSIYFVRAYGTEEVESQRIDSSLDKTLRAKTRAEITSSFSVVAANFIGALGRFVLIWYGLSEIIHGRLTIGGFLAFNSFLRYIYEPSKNLMNINATIQQSLASLERVNKTSEDTDTFKDEDGEFELKEIGGKVDFKNVTFSYNGDRGPALKNISFSVMPSTLVAVVGPNGAGKTTLMNLLLRLYKPDSGKIEIDNIDISCIKGQSLRPQIGFVPQDIYLLSSTIAYNIAYGTSSKSRDEIIQAAKLAEAHDFIMKLPDSYETVVGEKGVSYNFSGGEKQRLAIARVFLKQPRILVFDEAASSIDNESSYAIRKAMGRLMKNKTSFIIAHRLSTVVNADTIVVLDSGNLVQMGTHKALLGQEGLYRRLYEKELFKEEK